MRSIRPAATAAAMLIAASAFAAIVVTETPGRHELVIGSTLNVYDTHAACVAAARAAGVGQYACKAVTTISVVGVCDAPPPAPLPQTELFNVALPGGNDFRFEVAGWVPAPHPVCWTAGRVPLKYLNDAETPQVHELRPWVEGLDYPKGTPAPTPFIGTP